MRDFYLLLIGFSFVFACSEKENPKALPVEKSRLKIIVDDELGDGAYFKDFLDAIKNKDCTRVKTKLDEKVYFSLGESTNAIFSRKTEYREEKLKFSICDLFFDTNDVRKRVAILVETNDLGTELGSPRDWLDKSVEINFFAKEATSKGDEVNVVFLGGRYSEPQSMSRDIDFLFRCPNGFLKKCFLYSYTLSF